MTVGVWQLLLVLLIVFVVFGAGKLPKVMSQLGSGLKALRSSLSDTPKKK